MTELALIISVVGLTLITMEVYFKRGISGKVKDLTDGVIGSEQAVYQQDTSGLLINTSASTTDSNSNTNFVTGKGGGIATVGTEKTVMTYSSDYSN